MLYVALMEGLTDKDHRSLIDFGRPVGLPLQEELAAHNVERTNDGAHPLAIDDLLFLNFADDN